MALQVFLAFLVFAFISLQISTSAAVGLHCLVNFPPLSTSVIILCAHFFARIPQCWSGGTYYWMLCPLLILGGGGNGEKKRKKMPTSYENILKLCFPRTHRRKVKIVSTKGIETQTNKSVLCILFSSRSIWKFAVNNTRDSRYVHLCTVRCWRKATKQSSRGPCNTSRL